jgi:Galactose oxidase, central domain
MKRLLVTVVTAFLVVPALLANNPSPRTEVRMVYDPATTTSILFGGRSSTDYGTAIAYYSNETWAWNGSRWAQRFPQVSPIARSSYGFAFDTTRNRAILFGGRNSDTNMLGDTWSFQNDEWTELHPAATPGVRQAPGMAYDPLRDRVVLFGGGRPTADNLNLEPLYDMWEFDGTNWRQVLATGPSVIKPMLVWDGARHQMVLMGINNESKTLMYTFDPATSAWTEVKPANLPPCANEASLVYMERDGLLALVGGACGGLYDTAYYYDGINWHGFGPAGGPGYVFAAGVTYDVRRDAIVVFGGSEGFSTPRSSTYTYSTGSWALQQEIIRPLPRAATSFVSDPINKAIWMFGGLNQFGDGYYEDLWRFQNGSWGLITVTENAPSGCGSAAADIDTDRQQLVVICNGNTVYELDLKAITWKKFADLRDGPQGRRLAHVVYDPVQKKTVMYGGFDNVNYRNDTWTWDGTTFTEIKKDKADARSNAAMWFDPTTKKIMLYGGIGRPQPENTIRRYSDMWSFDPNSGWTQMKDVATPGERYDARVLVDPRTNKVMLYGGIRVDQVDEKIKRQVFADDMWEWNGTRWAKVTNGVNIPTARQAFGLAYDAYADRIVMFAGYNGLFLSDVWMSQDWLRWEPREESLVRRRLVRR